VIGSCSNGNATAVPKRIRDVTVAAEARATHGSRVRRVTVVREGGVAGSGMGGIAADRNVGVLGHVERVEPVLLRGLSRPGRADAAVTGEQHHPEPHTAGPGAILACSDSGIERPVRGVTCDFWIFQLPSSIT